MVLKKISKAEEQLGLTGLTVVFPFFLKKVFKTSKCVLKNRDLEVERTFFSLISLRFNKKSYLCNR